MISEYQRLVEEFHKAFGLATNLPLDRRADELVLRRRLIAEEAREFAEAEDPAHQLKEACDLIYVLAGAGVALGVRLDRRKPTGESVRTSAERFFEAWDRGGWVHARPAAEELIAAVECWAAVAGRDLVEAFRRVHASNMSKMGVDGHPMLRNDGKLLKGPNYFEPDLRDLVLR